MPRHFLLLAAVNGLLAVLLGAFGSHGLEGLVSAQSLATWDTAVRYHMFHALAFLAPALLAAQEPAARLRGVALLFLAGIVLFCGSLYLLALTSVGALGFITPLGGLAFLAGWGLLIFRLARP